MMVKRPNMRKVALFLIFILMFQLVSGIFPTFADGDTTAPIIRDIHLSSSEISIGENIEIKAEIQDDISGVDGVLIHFRSPSGRVLDLHLRYNATSGLYEGTYAVTSVDEGGLWQFQSIYVSDKAGNREIYYANDLLFNVSFTILNENGDITPPEVINIGVNPETIMPGEQLKVKVEIQDDMSGVDGVLIHFRSPGGRVLDLHLRYNATSGLYEGTYAVTSVDEGGLWQFQSIYVSDKAGNREIYYANDLLFNVSFTILNENGDITPPEVINIGVNPETITPGEQLKVKVEIQDDMSGVDGVLIHFRSPGGRVLDLHLRYNATSGLYEGTYAVTSVDEEGFWKFQSIYVSDKAGNRKIYYSNELPQGEEYRDFIIKHGIDSLENPLINDITLPYAIVTKNETWRNITIDKDIYIGPNSSVSIADNVTIKGNVYVYGTLISHGGLTIQGSLNAKSVTYGSNTSVSPGAVRFVGGQNSISSIIVSNQPYEVPFKIDNENLTNETGTLEIAGKTLPFLDVSLQGNPVSLAADGSFTTIAEGVTSEGIQFNLRDVFGNDIHKEFAVKDVLPPADVSGFTVSNETHNEIGVTWNTGTDSDLKEYGLYLNGELVMTVAANTTEYTFENLNEGTLYELGIAAIDVNGNKSGVTKATATTLLSKPAVNPVSDKSTAVTGQASPGTKVSVQKGEAVIGSGITDAAGEFNIEISAQKAGTELTVSVSNEAGIVSEKALITVEDKTAPALPTVNSVSDKDLTVSGTAEAKSAITVKAGETVIAEGTADELGKFSIALEKQQAGLKLSVTAADAAGNISEAKEITVSDLTAPEKPIVDKVTDKTISITGTVEAGSVVSVKAGATEIGKATVNQEGNYAVTIQKQQAGTVLKLTATDKTGNVSQETQVTVLDATAPALPTVAEVTDKSTVVKGTAEADSVVTVKAAEIEIGKATANSGGDFAVTITKQKAGTKLSVTATDAAGNVSALKAVTVLDVTAPTAPTVDKVTDQSVMLTGSGEAGAFISIKAGNTELGTAIVASDGTYNASIAVQKVGTKIQVTATDAAGNVSAASEVIVMDGTAPTVPVVDEVTDQSTAVTGSAEAASQITVKNGSEEIGITTVNTDGTYSVTIPKQKAGSKISVTATDAAGNISSTKEVIVLDVTAPSLPTVNTVTEQSTTVSGNAEAETLISVKAGTSVIGTSTVQADGTYSVNIPKQKVGTVLAITASDKAGNTSPVKEVVVADGTAPAVELTSKVTQHSVRVIGTAEAGAKIAIQAGIASIGTAVADAKGDYEVVIAKQKIGTKLSIVATDAAGNSSAPLIVTVEDGNYPDLKLTHWALDEIMYLADDQIIGGYPNGGFQPEKNTTRAEAAKMLALAMDLPIENVSSAYKDVSGKHWAKDYIAAVSKAGLFNGNPDGTFAPDTVLKRAEMAKVISIAYELKASDNNHFNDVKSGYWAKGYISGLYENGITTGYPDNTFRAEESTTRAEFSVFLARALNQDFR